MATTANIALSNTSWTAILTSADGPATIEIRGGDIEYAYSSSAIAAGSIMGATLQETKVNAIGVLENNQLRFSKALLSGITLYAKVSRPDKNVTAIILKDLEMFGS